MGLINDGRGVGVTASTSRLKIPSDESPFMPKNTHLPRTEKTGAKEWAFALAKNGFSSFQAQPGQWRFSAVCLRDGGKLGKQH